MQIDPSKVQWDGAPAIDPSAVSWDGEKPGMLESGAMGFLRGTKDVIDTGAQWLASGFDKLAGTAEGERVKAMNDAGKADFKSQYGDSTAASIGRFGGNIAATMPVGGFLGAGVRGAGALTGTARVAEPLAQAIASGGMRAGGVPGAAGLATRAAGGAISGGAMAGLVDPSSAGTGALIGAATPVAVQGAGSVMKAIGGAIRGPAAPAGIQQAAQAAQQAGYVIPPTQVRPNLMNRILEGTAGKLSTAQNASARNQGVTNRLAASAVGLDPTQPITKDSLKAVRDVAGEAYEALKGRGSFAVDDEYLRTVAGLGNKNALINEAFPGIRGGGMHGDPVDGLVKSMTPTGENLSAEATVEAIKQLRFQAKGNMKNFQDPVKLELGRAQSNASEALESLIERNLANSENPELLGRFKDARQLIAKTRTIEDALNGASGNVDASKLAQALKRGRPLSGDLLAIAQFASRFPKAAQTVEKMGSLPQTSPLDWALAGGTSAATANPLGMLMMGVRPAARAAALSGPVQRGLLAQPGPVGTAVGGLLRAPATDGLLGLSARTAPLLSIDR